MEKAAESTKHEQKACRFGFKRICDVTALVGAMIGATLVASNIGYGSLGYFFFTLSALASLYLLKTTNGPGSLILLNLFFVAANTFGFFRHF